MVGKRLTKTDKAIIQQNREKKYNLEMMLKNKTISKEYYDKKISLITVYGGMHQPK